ncbi:cysteine desulfurase [Haematospirillum sp. H1815]|uniref:cysteine desulfurase family protein n=1 Tax=Haematospirillum sp. H1815 TaxID=2723108 RepID=UPI00143ADBF9|nr:cysteine desulfurase family protein [Haematospirillum sp. H1815]NKD76690.1 cysteine desulfurase [Haematospirillum sp. H1815]
MSTQTVYLDYNATAPVRPQAVDAVTRTLQLTGNPSSVHNPGRKARAIVEDAREAVAQLVGAVPSQVIFTSGGTEALALALQGSPPGPRLVSSIEHPCVRVATPEATDIAVTQGGIVDLEHLENLLRTIPAPALVAVMLANNETGVIQPVRDVVRIAHATGAKVVCDAVQAVGKIPVDFQSLDVDTLALSGHKWGGPQGIGALITRTPEQLVPLFAGGGQERGKRGGTPNTPGIAGLGAAAEAALNQGQAERERILRLRNNLESRIAALAPGARIWGHAENRLPNTTCVELKGVNQQRQIMTLDLAGIAVSAGSACSSGKTAPSPVLAAMGASESQARDTIRISLGWNSQESDIEAFLTAWSPLARAAA